MDSGDGFVPIVALFFALFHPTEGTKVIHQVPSGSIVPVENSIDSSALPKPLFDFDAIKNYVIPKAALCNKLLTFKIGNYRVIGFPANVYSQHYARNSFSFNFCFVFPYESNTTPYEGNIKRIGKMFRALEEQSQLLSKSEKGHEIFFKNSVDDEAGKLAQKLKNSLKLSKHISENQKYLKLVEDWDEGGNQMVVQNTRAPGQMMAPRRPKFSSLQSLVQQIFQDLNNYSECMIPIDAANSVDIKLFPIFPPPPDIDPFDVPIATVKLESMVDALWDPTMLKIIPFINGINSVEQISDLSGTDFELTRQCIQHLIHYKSVAILDIFQFSNCYAVTADIGKFLTDPVMSAECQAYVISIDGTFNGIPVKDSHSTTNSETTSVHSVAISPKKPIYGASPSFHSHSILIDSTEQSAKYNFAPESQNSLSERRRPRLGGRMQSSMTASKTIVYTLPSKAVLFSLYRSLNQHTSVRQWFLEHNEQLEHIDIRKFITFGVLRGIIYRVRAYPVVSKLVNSIDFGMNYSTERLVGNPTKNYNVGALPFVQKRSLQKLKESEDDEANEEDDEEELNEEDEEAMQEEAVEDDEANENAEKIRTARNSFGEEYTAPRSLRRMEREESWSVEKMSIADKEKRERIQEREQAKLLELLKQTKDFDMICTVMRKSRRDVCSMMNRFGSWHMVNS